MRKWDQCGENLSSFAHMAVASLVGYSFCQDLGYLQAHSAGLDVTKAREVPGACGLAADPRETGRLDLAGADGSGALGEVLIC